MQEYIAGVREICERKMREWEIMCGVRVIQSSHQTVSGGSKNYVLPSIFDILLSSYMM